eukprot:s102_g29.t1
MLILTMRRQRANSLSRSNHVPEEGRREEHSDVSPGESETLAMRLMCCDQRSTDWRLFHLPLLTFISCERGKIRMLCLALPFAKCRCLDSVKCL